MGYSSSVHKNAADRLAQRRLAAEKQADDRRRQIYEKYPRARELEQAIASCGSAAVRAVLHGGDVVAEMNRLKEKNLSLLRKPESALTVVKDEEGAVVPTADFENGRDVGSLEISKKVNGTSDKSKSFTFEVRLSMNSVPLSGSFPADASASVLQASGIENGKITFDAGGEATVVLKADEKIVIRNLPAGAGYTVRETGIPKGYSKTKPGRFTNKARQVKKPHSLSGCTQRGA